MGFRYSCFISYRRHQEDQKFIIKLKKLIEVEAFKVTNKSTVFFDENSINWGEDFDNKIYNGIVSSYFFIPFFHHVYMHEENTWCAKELHWAIQIENKIRERVSDYCFILPLIDRGTASDFPECLGKKNAKEIKKFRHLITGGGTSRAFEEFKSGIYEILLQNFSMLNTEHLFISFLDTVEPASDEEIKKWIKEQKTHERETAASHLPTLAKYEF